MPVSVPVNNSRQAELLRKMRGLLEPAFGQRLQGLVLYGSEARGTADADSDIDLLVLLTGPVDFGQDLRLAMDALYPLVLELERPIHPLPLDVAVYQAQEFPLYRAAKREGILA
jgi:predicted nucleotidyltransferase